MGNFYENDDEFKKCLSLYHTSFGKQRQLYLEEICRFKTKSADEFWKENLKDERFLPYIMMCRSNEFSDYSAERLNDFLDRVLEGMDLTDAVNEAFFLLHVCAFKESDKLMSVYAKAARNSAKLKKMNLSWRSDVIVQRSQSKVLYDRYLAEREQGCENSFFTFLTDMLIITAANAIETDGEYETFTDKVKELYDSYPDVFAEAGFFAWFVTDNSAAYDKFAEYLEDPVTYPKIFWVLDGFSFENGKYIQGSPTVFVGPDNDRKHYSIEIQQLDMRWISFLTEKTAADTDAITVTDPYFMSIYCRKFSDRVFDLINHDSEGSMKMCTAYFRKTAVIAGNPADFAGLLECGSIKTKEDLTGLCLDIAERICEGRQRYCFHILFHFFQTFPREEKLEAVMKTAEYIREYEYSEALAGQRKEFLEQAERFAQGKQSCFEDN